MSRKIIYDPNEVLAFFATHSAVEVGIAMQFVIYSQGRALTDHEMSVITERIIHEYTELCDADVARAAVNRVIPFFADLESDGRNSFLSGFFKSVG